MTRGGARRVRRGLAFCLLAGSLAAPSRATSEAERLADLLDLGPGRVVADVGAGEGSWTVALAAAVAPGGAVFATEVTDELVKALGERIREEDLDEVTVLRGATAASGLPAACCDAILLRLVYHHFTEPAGMLADLDRALRPGGRLVIVETVPQSSWRRLDGVPDRGGHGIEPDRLVAELAAAGFRERERHVEWNGDPERYALVFVAATADPPGE